MAEPLNINEKLEIADLVQITRPPYTDSIGIIERKLEPLKGKKEGSFVVRIVDLGRVVRERKDLVLIVGEEIKEYTDPNIWLMNMHLKACTSALEIAMKYNDEELIKEYSDKIESKLKEIGDYYAKSRG